MRLKILDIFRHVGLCNAPREQHAAGFAADRAGADHTLVDAEVVLRGEMAQNQLRHALLTRDEQAAHIRQTVLAQHPLFVLHAREGKEALPAVQMLFGVREILADLIKPADGVTLRQRDKPRAVKSVRLEHGRRVAVPDLERLDIVGAVAAVDIEQNLRGRTDAADGVVRMPSADDREVCHGIQLE